MNEHDYVQIFTKGGNKIWPEGIACLLLPQTALDNMNCDLAGLLSHTDHSRHSHILCLNNKEGEIIPKPRAAWAKLFPLRVLRCLGYQATWSLK